MNVSDTALVHGPDLAPDRLRARLAELGPVPVRSSVPVVRAPGRVNLIGEHTDYNLGYVLPAAIDLEVWIAFVPARDRHVELVSDVTGERARFDLDAISPSAGGMAAYVAGTAWALAEAGIPTRGVRGVLASSLPRASGLSSSAALELATAWTIAEDPAAIGPLELARICQRAENAYVGVNCGLMDQFASACGVAGAAMLLDCQSLDWQPVPLPLARHTLVVIHTGSIRSLSSSQYNARRAQCEAAAAVLVEVDPSIRSLRDVTPAMLPAVEARVDGETYRRCRHVVTENVRVKDTIAALATGDLAAVGALFAASHASLRDDYEVVSPELEALVEIAASVPGVAAARMTGAGFGGCTINLVERDAVAALRERVLAGYPGRTGLTPRVYVVNPVAGAGFALEG
ncbi:MAG: galactokinase [Candidatus Limnocylindria bacterium]